MTQLDRVVWHKRRTKSANLPNFPPEVWGLVIRHANLLDYDPLDISKELSFADQFPLRLATYRSAMKIKTTIALVSRQWNTLVQKHLYEFVQIYHPCQAKTLSGLLSQDVHDGSARGLHIRRLHIETPILERCSPIDLRNILDHSPNLCMYSDHHSIQRSLFAESATSLYTPEEILRLVAHPKMRSLSWTSYGDVSFRTRIGPLLTNLSDQLEYLELTYYLSKLHMDPQPVELDNHTTIYLPSLQALKVALDNDAFAILSTWTMPQLKNLSILSSDFSYMGPGFASFLNAYGNNIHQLELRYCSTIVERHYLTTPQHTFQPQSSKSLAKWLPNLREFIFSVDAELHWESPSWIGPHILLPAHPNVEFVGIRNIHVGLCNDPDSAEGKPYFTLYTRICSLLSVDLFPSLRSIRDISEESHNIRTMRPKRRITQFWMNVLERCRDRGVCIEDYAGINITVDSLLASTPKVVAS